MTFFYSKLADCAEFSCCIGLQVVLKLCMFGLLHNYFHDLDELCQFVLNPCESTLFLTVLIDLKLNSDQRQLNYIEFTTLERSLGPGNVFTSNQSVILGIHSNTRDVMMSDYWDGLGHPYSGQPTPLRQHSFTWTATPP